MSAAFADAGDPADAEDPADAGGPVVAAVPAEAGAATLRRLFRRHAAGVSVITAIADGRPVGLLVTSLASVSGEPPLIVFNVNRSASSWPALESAEHIGVHVLSESQQPLADRFARTGEDRFAPPTRWHPGLHGVPLIDGSAARAVAVIEQRVVVADHVIVIARLLQADVPESDEAPLLHHNGGYHRVHPLSSGRLGTIR